MNIDLKIGDLIRFDTRQYGWSGVIAIVTCIAKNEEGKTLIQYETHGYRGTTTSDRVIPLENHAE